MAPEFWAFAEIAAGYRIQAQGLNAETIEDVSFNDLPV